MRRLTLILALLAAAMTLRAQPADVVVRDAPVVAVFEEARALAIDPFGQLYVADAGRGVVYQLSPLGAVLATLGAPGVKEGAFDDPSDVDPTNGLIILVADAGNGRIQRFSRSMAFLGALPLPGANEPRSSGSEGQIYRRQEVRRVSSSEGRPVAVASGRTNETFAVDADRGTVVRWDRNGRYDGEIGGFGAGDGTLAAPVALAVDGEGSLFVADQGEGEVVVFDLFGGYVRRIAVGAAPDVQALFIDEERLWIVLPGRLLVYDTNGTYERAIDVELSEPLVDAAVRDGILYLLTPRALRGWPIDP